MVRRPAVLALPLVVAAACGGDDATAPPTPSPSTFSVSGVVRGLKGRGLALQVGTETLLVNASGDPTTFAFATRFVPGTAYDVKVANAPANPDQVCTVTGGAGTIVDRNVSNVDVLCANVGFAVSGTISGVDAGTAATLSVAGEDLVVTSASPGFPKFAFTKQVAYGAAYEVTVKTPPSGKACAVENGKGTATAPITDVKITCVPAFAVGGSVSNLPAGGTVVIANGGDELSLSAQSPGFPTFAFPKRLPTGTPYAVTVKTSPAGRRCTVRQGAGTMAAADVTTVNVDCGCNPTILFLANRSGFEGALVARLQQEGFAVTTKPVNAQDPTGYAGQPDASTFGTIFYNPAQSNTSMDAAGQQAILNAYQAGTGWLGAGPILWRTANFNGDATLRPLFLFQGHVTMVGNVNVNLTLSASAPATHPVLAGLPVPFVTTQNPYYNPSNAPLPGSTSLLTDSSYYGTPAVLVKDAAAAEGRRAQIPLDPFGGADRITADGNFTRLFVNALKWTSRCE